MEIDTPPPPPPPPPEVDLLSSLPEHLQDEILKRLNIRDAVRTSAISRAWRRRWETIEGLALSFPDGTPTWVIDQVIRRYAGRSISQFACRIDSDEDEDDDDDDEDYVHASASHVGEWLTALSRRRVRDITILNSYGGRILPLHTSIFSCRRLVSLNLEWCSIPPAPQPQPGRGFAAAGFPLLKNLYLTSVAFADNGEIQLQAMLRASPRLRVLFLQRVDASDIDRVIEAPNVRFLGLASSTDYWRFGELPRLKWSSVNVPDYLQNGPDGFVELLAGVSQVQNLILYLPESYFKMEAIPFTFCNLKRLELFTYLSGIHHILSMFCMLRSSPNLGRLKITVRSSTMDADQEFLNAQWTDGMCANLQVVQFTSYKGWLPLPFIELILSKASRLCTLSVDACCPVSEDEPLSDLLNSKKASPRAQILFKV